MNTNKSPTFPFTTGYTRRIANSYSICRQLSGILHLGTTKEFSASHSQICSYGWTKCRLVNYKPFSHTSCNYKYYY